jgi:putative endopeptidase
MTRKQQPNHHTRRPLAGAAQRRLIAAAALTLIAGLGHAAGPAPSSGIARANMETSVRAQNDFYRYVNGKWLKAAEIPADQPMWGAFIQLDEEARPQLRAIVERAAASNPAPGTDAQRIGDFYASYMDEARVDRLGLNPLKGELDRIAGLKDRKELPALLAHLQRLEVKLPFEVSIDQDQKNSTRYVAIIGQGGLGLPDRDYYLSTDDAKLGDTRAGYRAYAAKVLTLAGDGNATVDAQAVLAFETALAKAQWSAVELRDPVKGYNKVALADLNGVTPGFDWTDWLAGAGLAGKAQDVILSQPTYLKAFAGIAADTPLDTWKAYLTVRLFTAYAKLLSKDIVDTYADFNLKTLYGLKELPAREKRALDAVEAALGEALGKLYVAEHFPAERKARIEAMVRNLLAAYKESIDKLDWMTPATKKEAQAKLAKFNYKIGYPDKWRDYSALVVKRDDLVGNVVRARAFEYERQLDKLGKPIDRAEWEMTPQTVNAYYTSVKNEIVFPAVMLQPPFFDPDADDAVNYGAIGGVIGHEISHGFDDQGAQYDGDGNLRDWWNAEDHKRFDAKAKMLVEQYKVFEPLPGYRVNGELTLGENIADDSGLAIAYKAYKISLKGKKSPVIDGFTGEQRFYLGWAQAWREKTRDAFRIQLLKMDPHSPGEFRVNGTLRNEAGFYEAFGVKPGDKLYLAPKDRVVIW